MLNIETWEIEKLIPYINNPRKNDHAVESVASAIREFGFKVPIVAKSDGTIIDGHLRYKAAKRLNFKEVPVILADDLTEAQIKAFRISVNKMAELAEWDEEMLKIEIEELYQEGYDIDLLGFTDDELKDLDIDFDGEDLPELDETKADEVPEVEETPVIKRGDIIELGNHRLMCGDSTSIDAVEKLMDGEKAHLLHTDPPYGVSYDGKGGSKKWDQIKNDAVVGDGLVDFLVAAFNAASTVLRDSAAWYVWHGYKGTFEFYEALRLAGKEPGAQIVWVKNGLGTMWSNYRPKHECAIYVSGKFYGGFDQSTVWEAKRERDYVHPTQKPIEIVERALCNSTDRGDMVLDLFGGSGSTLIAAEKNGRTARLMELDEKYAQVIIQRWCDYTSIRRIKINGIEVDWEDYKEKNKR